MIENIPVAGLTAPTLLLIAILLMFTGRLFPRATVMDIKEERDTWRAAYEKERDARATANQQSMELLEGLKTNHAVVVAMFEAIKSLQRGGGYVAPQEQEGP